MSFNSFNFESLPVTTSNKPGFPTTPSSYTDNHFTHSACNSDTFCFKTPLQNSTTSTPIPSHSQGSKSRKENEPLIEALDLLPSVNPPSKKCKTTRDKLDSIFLAIIKKERLTFGEFIYLVSHHNDENNQPIQRSQTHTMSVFKERQHTHHPWLLSAGTRVQTVEQVHLGPYLCLPHHLFTPK